MTLSLQILSKCIGKKGLVVGPLNLQKCEFIKPAIIDDTDLTRITFANMALDHCNETKVKNLKDEEGKILKRESYQLNVHLLVTFPFVYREDLK